VRHPFRREGIKKSACRYRSIRPERLAYCRTFERAGRTRWAMAISQAQRRRVMEIRANGNRSGHRAVDCHDVAEVFASGIPLAIDGGGVNIFRA